MRIRRVIDGLEFLLELNEVRVEALECVQLAHAVQLLIHLSPLEVIQPIGRVWLGLTFATGSCQEEAPFERIHLIVTEHDLGAQEEGEQKFVPLEQRPANVAI